MVVFPELPLTTFFPRWLFSDQAELDSYFEREMPNPRVQPLFDRARALGIGFYLGYAELTPHGKRYNTAITVGPDGSVLGKYRKIHLPGTVEPRVGIASSNWKSAISNMVILASPPFAARKPGAGPCLAC
jgi:predicted amidohydrolase